MICCRASCTPTSFSPLSIHVGHKLIGDLTIASYGKIKPVIRSYCCCTPCTTASTPNVAITLGVRWRMRVNPVLGSQLPIGEGRGLGFTHDDRAVIDQSLYGIGTSLSRKVQISKCAVRCRRSHTVEIIYVLDSNTKTVQGLFLVLWGIMSRRDGYGPYGIECGDCQWKETWQISKNRRLFSNGLLAY